MFDAARLALQVWRRERMSAADLAAYQETRFQEQVAFTRRRSRLYADLYRGLPEGPVKLAELPPVTRPELLDRFDDWVTDPEIKRAEVEAFVDDERQLGQLYLGRYAVYQTSATTGERGLFLHDQATLALLRATQVVRTRLRDRTLAELLSSQRQGWRSAVIAIIGNGRAVSGSAALWLTRNPRLAQRLRLFSSSQPLADLLEALDDWQPAELLGPPNVLALVAEQQLGGRLRIKPNLVICCGEALVPATRAVIGDAFGCAVRDQYAASELALLASECARERLHLNADRLLVEPVDEHNRPIPVGQRSKRVLVTHLVGRVAPLIRYELDDSLRFDPEPCACGRTLPVIQIEGRVGQLLSFEATGGSTVRVSASQLENVLRQVPGLTRYQLIQTGAATLTLRLPHDSGLDQATVLAATERYLREYLSGQGLDQFALRLASRPPEIDAQTGKLRKVLVEFTAESP